MSLVASSVPGRLRLRDAALRDPQRLELLHGTLARWPGVLALEANAKTGSLLIHYDAMKLTRERCEVRALAAAGKLLGKARNVKEVEVGAGGTAAHAHHPGPGGTPRVKANRWAKRGMLTSLAVSLLLAGLGGKRWHALTGVLFLHALALHLFVHRRHLLR